MANQSFGEKTYNEIVDLFVYSVKKTITVLLYKLLLFQLQLSMISWLSMQPGHNCRHDQGR